MQNWKPIVFAALTATIVLCAATVCLAELSSGQTIYVPCYSHIYHGAKARPFDLTVTLSVRSTDTKGSMNLVAVDYYDTDGKLIRSFLQKPERLAPLATKEYIVDQIDSSGGSGANFIIRWTSEEIVNAPLVETVMIGTSSQQGISFTSRGVAIDTK